MLRQHGNRRLSITAREFATLGQRAEKTLDQYGLSPSSLFDTATHSKPAGSLADIGQRVTRIAPICVMSLGVSGAASMAPEGTPGSRVAAYRDEEEELWIEPVFLNNSNVARWPVSPKVLTAIFLPDQVLQRFDLGLVGKQLVGGARLVGGK